MSYLATALVTLLALGLAAAALPSAPLLSLLLLAGGAWFIKRQADGWN